MPASTEAWRSNTGGEMSALKNPATPADSQPEAILQAQIPRSDAATELLANIGKELSSSLDLEELLNRLVHVVVPDFADWCVIDVVEEGYQQTVAVAHVDPAKEGLAREIQRRFGPISSESSPMRQVFDSAQPRFIAEYTPNLSHSDGIDGANLELLRQLMPKSIVSVPLTGRRGPIGVLSFLQSDSDRRFGPHDVSLAQEIASRAALAVENAQLYRDMERTAARRRESEERLRLLAEMSKLLDSSLDYRATLDSLARLAVQQLADWCVVDIIQKGRLGQSIAIAARDSAKEPIAREFQGRWPASMDDAGGTAKVIRTGEPEFVPEITDEMIIAGARGPEHLEIMRALGPWTSGMSVPLRARGRTLGALTLIRAESGQRYGPDDLELAMEMASRAALAVDNSQIYAAEQRARAEAERLQELTQQISQSLSPEQVLQQVATTAAQLLEAQVAGVYLLDAAGEYFDLVAGEGFDVSEGTDLRLPRGQSAAGQVIATGRPENMADVSAAPVTALPRIVSGEAVGSLVVAPIISRSGPLGVVEVYSRTEDAFADHDAQLLLSLAAAAATAIENARLYRERELDLARLRTIVEQLPVGIVVAEAPSGEVSLKNSLADDLCGTDISKVRPGTFDPREGYHQDGRRFELQEWPLARALANGEVVSNEHADVNKPDGGQSHLSINAAPIRDAQGEIIAAVAVFEDVSGEEELRRQKEQFLAAAAHDLKTPLTSIRGLSQLLQRQIGRLDLSQSERITATLEGIAAGTRKMASLIEELLDLTRLETIGELSLNRSETDIVALAKSAVSEHRGSAPQHDLVLESVTEHISGNWDEARMERALSNLIGNAIKYSPGGGEIRVGISTEVTGGREFVVVSVSDKGIGIPAGEVDRIFERFQRGSNVPPGLSGSGVGLPYVQEIVKRHGGSISVDSKAGEGSTFSVRLPWESA